jgi:hypothetical protein
LVRFAEDLAAETPGQPFRPYPAFGMAPNFRNGYIETYTAGLHAKSRSPLSCFTESTVMLSSQPSAISFQPRHWAILADA